MHKCSQGNQQLVPFYPEIEATERRQSGLRRKQQEKILMAERDPRVLQDYVPPQVTDITSSIVNLTVEANNFELRPALVSFVEKDQFKGHPMENAHIHLRNFLVKYDTIKLNRVSIDALG